MQRLSASYQSITGGDPSSAMNVVQMTSTTTRATLNAGQQPDYDLLAPAALAALGAGMVGGASQPGSTAQLGYTRASLQHTFKHANDFGVTGNANNKTMSEFSLVIQSHVDAVDTRVIQGTYRGNPVTHYVNPQTGLNVIQDASGNLLSGWKLSPQQLQNVLNRGSL